MNFLTPLPPALGRFALLGLCLGLVPACQTMEPEPYEPYVAPAPPEAPGPVLIATWPFGQKATDLGWKVLQDGGSSLDAIEQGIGLIESLGCDGTVGLAGRPNAAGYPQLDACIMNGPDHNAGSVAALEGIVHPISAARRVMEHSPHVMLVGEGARWFALEHGLDSIDVSDLPAKKEAFVQQRSEKPDGEVGHDTIGLLLLDAQGNLVGGASTSGRVASGRAAWAIRRSWVRGFIWTTRSARRRARVLAKTSCATAPQRSSSS